MTIAFSEDSKYSEEINQNNWYEILLRKDVKYGRSDPNSDPCGYRTVIVSQLAEKHYNKAGFSDRILIKDMNYIRPMEIELLALLESKSIDYIFIYRSVAEQHGLKYIILPDEINLKKTEFKENYSKASIDIFGKPTRIDR